MIEKLKTLKTSLGEARVILTGSMALVYHGLHLGKLPQDLDVILVKPSATAKAVLESHQKANPSKRWKEGSPVTYSFMYNGVKIDIWVVEDYADAKNSCFTSDGIELASIEDIVAAKKSYNRPKDHIQLMQLSRRIFNEESFRSKLNDINTYDTDESYDSGDE